MVYSENKQKCALDEQRVLGRWFFTARSPLHQDKYLIVGRIILSKSNTTVLAVFSQNFFKKINHPCDKIAICRRY